MSKTKIVTGAYEYWNFGDHPFALGNIENKAVVALGEWDSPLRWQAHHDVTSPITGPRRVIPLNFDVSDADNPPELQFWPLMLAPETSHKKKDVSNKASFQWLNKTLISTAKDTTRPRSAMGSVRVNLPIDTETLNHRFSANIKPQIQPDKTVKAAIKKGKSLVIVAVIDDGLALAHQNFRSSKNRSRIEACWLQSAQPNSLASVPFGRELIRSDINRGLEDHGRDEGAFYRDPSIGATSSEDLQTNIFNARTHGTHVMDMAGGYQAGTDIDLDKEAANRLRLIAVQLPRTSLDDASGFGKDVFVLSGLSYIFSRARQIKEAYQADDISLLVNISLGITGGSHDGQNQLELAMDELIARERALGAFKELTVALPSANSLADRMRGTISSTMLKNNQYEFDWRIQPNDRTSSYLELWWRGKQSSVPANTKKFVKNYNISVIPPGLPEISLNNAAPEIDEPRLKVFSIKAGDNVIGQLSIEKYRDQQWRALLAVAPTEASPDAQNKIPRAAPSGSWHISITRKNPKARLKIDCYVQRDEDPAATGNGGRQSYLHDPTYRLYNMRGKRDGVDGTFVKRLGTINGWATSLQKTKKKQRLAIGGYIDRTDRSIETIQPARYSSAGEVDKRPAVDYSAPSDMSEIIQGIRAAGTRSGALAYLQGTSAATPGFIRANAVALLYGRKPQYETPSGGEREARLGKVDLSASRYARP